MLTDLKGQYARMKAMMSRHVEGVRHQMFSDSTNAVQKSLEKLIKDIEDFLLGKADEVFISVKRDYESVVLGRQAATHQLPREQRQIRADVNNIVEGTELIFKKAVGLEPETPEPAVEDPEEKAPVKAEEAVQDVMMDGIEDVEIPRMMLKWRPMSLAKPARTTMRPSSKPQRQPRYRTMQIPTTIQQKSRHYDLLLLTQWYWKQGRMAARLLMSLPALILRELRPW